MKLEVKTKTGSTYILDQTAMTWAGSNGTRTRSGALTVWPFIEVGEDLQVCNSPFDIGEIQSWKEIT